MKLATALACIAFLGRGAAAYDTDFEVHNNLAFLSPHIERPDLAVPFSLKHRRLATDCKGKAAEFKYNVASGDPRPDRVIIWTLLTPEANAKALTIPVNWLVATDPELKNVVRAGRSFTNSDVNFSVKAEPDGLQPATVYYYAFRICGDSIQSPVGKTKTAPAEGANVNSIKFATVSCSFFQNGQFNAYGRIADKADSLDAWLHLGDYVYESGNSARSRSINRIVAPDYEMLNLTDYRARYATYHTDIQLQRIRASIPLIAVPDDHEVTNNGWEEGADNHTPATEGDWQTRVDSAFRAYFEWLPISQFSADKQRVYRSFKFGDLVTAHMIDTRYNEREEQIPGPFANGTNYASWKSNALKRRIMSQQQGDWLCTGLKGSSSKYQLIGNQLLFSDTTDVECTGKYSVSDDAWGSYKLSQQELLQCIVDNKVKNVIINTGDSHTNWVFEVKSSPEYLPLCNGTAVAVEYGGTAVTSSNPGFTARTANATTADAVIAATTQTRLAANPSLIATDVDCFGYFISEYKPEAVYVTYYCVDTTDRISSGERISWRYKTCDGSSKAISADAVCPPRA